MQVELIFFVLQLNDFQILLFYLEIRMYSDCI